MLIQKCLTLSQIQYFRKGPVKSAKREESKVSMATQAQPTYRHLSPALRNYSVEDKEWQTSEWAGQGRGTKTSTSRKPAIKIQNSPTVHNTGPVFHTRDDGDDNENVKKAIGWMRQNNNFARASRFFVNFFAVTAQLRRESPNFTFTFYATFSPPSPS